MTTSPIFVEVSLLGKALEQVSAIAPPELWESWILRWLTELAPDLSPIGAYEVSLQFTDDRAIAQLNTQYRQQDKATDVLSFAVLDDTPLPPAILRQIPFNLGDIIISVETAQQQCEAHGHTLLEELAWLAAHGLLHLLGWDHPNETQLQAMLSKQRKLLATTGLNLNTSAFFTEEQS